MARRGICIYCDEKINILERRHDEYAHKRCRKVASKQYSSTWKLLSNKYVEHGFPAAVDFFPTSFEPWQDFDARMVRINGDANHEPNRQRYKSGEGVIHL